MPTKLYTNSVIPTQLRLPPHSATPLHAVNSLPEKNERAKLLKHLHRAGVYSHLWTDVGNRSHWFRVNGSAKPGERTIPTTWQRNNVYFAIHPLSRIPPQNASGNQDAHYISSQLPYIAAINTLFAEFDGKEYVWPWEYAHFLPENLYGLSPVERRKAIRSAKEAAFYRCPKPYKERAFLAIHELYYAPSVIVDSGGGYHCYWLLRHSVPVDDCNRSDLQAIQHSWVRMVGGDPGASDLRRMLRLPGTLNMKAGFGAHHPEVHFVKANFEQLYGYQELEEAVNDWLFAQRPVKVEMPTTQRRYAIDVANQETVRVAFNRQHSLVDLLVKHGYTVSFRGNGGVRLARPGRDKGHSSVTVFPAKADGTPELSVHFSTNDELYSEERVDKTSGKIRRQAHDAFYAFVVLEHEGNWQAAYGAV